LMHEVNALWPFHEVHHSADKLTSLQAGRNNPFDAFKTYSMIIVLSLLGLPDDIFTYVTMLVATNGFLQHSNADIDLGKAEYLISGPKAHRWHHSTVIREGNTNFGNTLMIWDHMPWHKVPIFGKLLKFQRKTFFMPKDREAPDEVGLNQTLIDDNKSVLQNYMDQIWHPFRKIFFGGDHANS